jgi:hypothetical protein
MAPVEKLFLNYAIVGKMYIVHISSGNFNEYWKGLISE